MGRMSKRKGASGEREAAKEIAIALGCEAQRGVQFQGGHDSPDVKTSIADVHIEVKRCETLSLYTAMQQAIDDAQGKVPVVLHRRNGKEWLAVVPLKELMRLSVQLYLTRASNV